MRSLKDAKPEVDRLDLKPGGYAPGRYLCACTACGCSFTGGKRAWRCADCAEDLIKAHDAPGPQQDNQS